jgi:hypothetical protein
MRTRCVTRFTGASVLLPLVAVCAFLPPRAARADGAPVPLGQTLLGAAKADYDSARSLYAEHDFSGALIKFTAAYAGSKDARLLWNMASCEGKRRHYTKALALLREFERDGGAKITDQDRREAAQFIAAIEPLTASTRIEVTPPGADVFVDDEPIGQSPLPLATLDIGVHTLRVQKAEFHDATERITITGGAEVPIRVVLTPVVHAGRLSVRGPEKAAIALDGAPLGVGAWSGEVKSGGHTLRVTASGMLPHQTEVLVEDGQAREVDVSLDPEPHRAGIPTWAWIAGGVVLAGGLGTGAYFLFKSSSKSVTQPTGTIGTVPSSEGIRF